MKSEIAVKSTVSQKAENGSLLFEVSVVSIPPSLRSGKAIAETIERLLEKERRARLERRRERFLKWAYEAEAVGNRFRAGRAFVLALYCDGLLRTPEVSDACGYVRSTLPVY